MRAPDAEAIALRTTAIATRPSHIQAVRFSGPGALDLLDVLVTSRLFIRENQMLHTLLLDEAARPWADAYLCQDEDSVIVLAEGPSAAELCAHAERVRAERTPSAEVEITVLTGEQSLIGVDGPYAWEAVSAVLGPEILGAPYLSFLKLADTICFRAGKTGEYGYLLLAGNARTAEVWKRLLDLGASQGLVEGSLTTLDYAALENWHFSMRALSEVDVARSLTPLELQLQWRVDYEKDFVGAEAMRARRRAPLGRVTCFVSVADSAADSVLEVLPGQRLHFDGREAGTVLWTGWSPVRAQWVGWALIELGLAWPKIRFGVHPDGGATVETRSPPLLNNRSLHVDPHRHSYQTRANDDFPPLVIS
jgi:aminomethyltransferase